MAQQYILSRQDLSRRSRLERLDPKGCPPRGRKPHPSINQSIWPAPTPSTIHMDETLPPHGGIPLFEKPPNKEILTLLVSSPSPPPPQKKKTFFSDTAFNERVLVLVSFLFFGVFFCFWFCFFVLVFFLNVTLDPSCKLRVASELHLVIYSAIV